MQKREIQKSAKLRKDLEKMDEDEIICKDGTKKKVDKESDIRKLEK